ncbi:hypothetical protein CEUSTIGMA_g12540.t1 [Chlamydomonas eustigma]|uniref:F-box domain-containing protein n=1 Tax=Chlamydomonas eustigma TaxID=1157962 RepID=A0A250XQP3_9CHLO|nr:hypothetical protein CEUSTIGMA_g12540.t1 [Chlamydomonas eustigma]|eukprot:GAX85120.1 hypothetical protein CEUSTIGMA_g12540.t1 [Chlamydomonas eustigma]
MSLLNVPEDVLIEILSLVSINDLQSISCTCTCLLRHCREASLKYLLSKYEGNLKLSFLEACHVGHVHACTRLLKVAAQSIQKFSSTSAASSSPDLAGVSVRIERISSAEKHPKDTYLNSADDACQAYFINLCSIGLSAAIKSGCFGVCEVILPEIDEILAASYHNSSQLVLARLADSLTTAACDGRTALCQLLCSWMCKQQQLDSFFRTHAGSRAASAVASAAKAHQPNTCATILNHPLYLNYRKSTTAPLEEQAAYWGSTLFHAAKDGQEEVVKLLLQPRLHSSVRSSLSASFKVFGCRSMLALPKQLFSKETRSNLINSVHTESYRFPSGGAASEALVQAIGAAAKEGHTSVLRMLLSCGPFDSDLLRSTCGTTLRFAAERGDLTLCVLLLQVVRKGGRKADVFEMRALCHAARQGQVQVCELLLAQPWYSNRVLWEAISRAMLQASTDMVRDLLLQKQQACLKEL